MLLISMSQAGSVNDGVPRSEKAEEKSYDGGDKDRSCD